MKQKMKQKKWLLTFLSVLAVLLSSVIGMNVYAAQKNNDVVHNSLRLPSVEGAIKEEFTPSTDIAIGDSQTKDIKVSNDGTVDFFVRVMVFPEISISNGKDPERTLPANLNKELEVVVGSDWEDGGDGYYYYKGKVAVGSTTPSLFTEVKMADGLGAEYTEADFTIQVKSETVTAANLQYRKVWWNQAVDVAPTDANRLLVDDVLKNLAG